MAQLLLLLLTLPVTFWLLVDVVWVCVDVFDVVDASVVVIAVGVVDAVVVVDAFVVVYAVVVVYNVCDYTCDRIVVC